ncbi:FxsA family protein [Gordonia neofelifaecis]|uniref:FxsA cytoplasmic membrane protein n=1 Tax=Gordonia neofelifaecis NRRL B-59395 TaxID=644548 RepID=F1YGR7_9ACTN|nr:FxsA family protein [Gordonia neofelifaecis]EGD56215.1 FxsA cytoplasmic membrane protein [Gordonia neofelifaecis NRRL B-59395]
MRYVFVGYLVAEIAAFWAMVHFLGFAWAFLITVLAAGVGYIVLARRARDLGTDMRKAMRNEIAPGEPLTDSALFGVAATLTIVPGIVSTLVGLLMLTRPARKLLRPVVTALAARRATLMADRMTVIDFGGRPAGGRGFGFGTHDYVDGTVEGVVVDTTVRNPDGTVHVDVPALPRPHEA